LIYCINPSCPQRANSDLQLNCESCGSDLIVHNRFKLLRLLQKSDEVDIYEAIDLTGTYGSAPNQIKVLKVLKSGAIGRRDLFRRGSQICMSLMHPGIPNVDVDDFFEVFVTGRSESLLCLAMEKIDGQNLTSWVRTYGKVSQARAIAWMQQIAEILDFIHNQGILHRD
jgi:serine/threonine protein kinase